MSKIPVKFARLHPDAVIPHKAHPEDVGYDMTAISREFLAKDGVSYIKYGTGIGVEIPTAWQFELRPRSSIYKYNQMLVNGIGTIEPNYIYEELCWMFRIMPNVNQTPSISRSFIEAPDLIREGEQPEEIRQIVTEVKKIQRVRLYKVGDRIGQIVLMPRHEMDIIEVTEFESGTRGGFGSTGT